VQATRHDGLGRATAAGDGDAAQRGVHRAQQECLLDQVLAHHGGQGEGARQPPIALVLESDLLLRLLAGSGGSGCGGRARLASMRQDRKQQRARQRPRPQCPAAAGASPRASAASASALATAWHTRAWRLRCPTTLAAHTLRAALDCKLAESLLPQPTRPVWPRALIFGGGCCEVTPKPLAYGATNQTGTHQC
jgi:hypothetical protein